MAANSRVDLIWLSRAVSIPAWDIGKVWTVDPTPPAVDQLIRQQLPKTDAYAWLFWHPDVGQPRAEDIRKALGLPGNVWHAGLALGTTGLPGLLDYVSSTWMLNCDPPPHIEATSWRLSLRACLVQTDVLRQMGGIRPDFKTLDAAALEMGHRYIRRGVLIRHIPWLAKTMQPTPPAHLPPEDELRFMQYGFNRFWTQWAVIRAALSRYVSPRQTLRLWQQAQAFTRPADPEPFKHTIQPLTVPRPERSRVTVLIPTVDRYPYLHTLLTQLRQQTVAPHEIIIVDQTEPALRDTTLTSSFSDLPIKAIYLIAPGNVRRAMLAYALPKATISCSSMMTMKLHRT